MDVVEDKNPKDPFGKTPLHWAAGNGHKIICKMIMDEVEDKNPKDLFGEFTITHFVTSVANQRPNAN